MFDFEVTRAGQTREYEDSIYEYVVHSDWPQNKVEEHCYKHVHKCKNKLDDKRDQFSGKSGFPFGLNSFYGFRKLQDDKYLYIVCQPYTG